MNVCVTATGNTIDAAIDPRFGRCKTFLFVDSDTLECSAVENPAASAGGGAGTMAAQLVAERRAEAVLTGNVGPNAFSALDAAGIKIYVGISGTVQDALEQLKSGKLQPVSAPSAQRHSGMRNR